MTRDETEPRLQTRKGALRRQRAPRRRRRVILIAALLLVVVIGGLAAWIGVRGYLAKNELEAALPLASQLKAEVTAGNTAGAAASAAQLSQHADEAARLTSDPIWRSAEILPWIGQNLEVMRELTSTVNDVSTFGVGPLAGLVGSISLSDFKPVDGRVGLDPLVEARPALAESSSAVDSALVRAQNIDADGAVGPLVDARDKLVDSLQEASVALDVLGKAAQLLPAMLGADGPRNYIVLFQNNAELRSTGGIPGALALVSTDAGSITLSQQTTANSFEKFPSPVIELPQDTKTLYGNNTAQYMQDVNFTPNFSLSGQIAREMWNQKFGVQADGVISIDPVALSYLLRATGPIELPTGDVMSSDNAVKLLLQDVYAKYPNTDDQDAFFASAAASVFAKIASGDVDPQAMIEALAQAGNENRVLIWSAHEDDQSVLAGTALAGYPPASDDQNQAFGLYFNDSTTAKMDPYLQVKIEAGQGVCRNDGLPLNSIRVTLTNTAPLDSATSLPEYVTGGGVFGIPPGNIRTNIASYGAEGLYNLGVARDGVRIPYQSASDDGFGVTKIELELVPGESTVLDFQYLGNDTKTRSVTVEHSPFVYAAETSPLAINCESALK